MFWKRRESNVSQTSSVFLHEWTRTHSLHWMLFTWISDVRFMYWELLSIGTTEGPKNDDYHNHAAGDSSNDNDHGGEDHDDDPAVELMMLSWWCWAGQQLTLPPVIERWKVSCWASHSHCTSHHTHTVVHWIGFCRYFAGVLLFYWKTIEIPKSANSHCVHLFCTLLDQHCSWNCTSDFVLANLPYYCYPGHSCIVRSKCTTL